MNIGEESREVKKDRKMVMREERLKEGKKERLVEIRKIEGEKLLREVMVKIVLWQLLIKMINSILSSLIEQEELNKKFLM